MDFFRLVLFAAVAVIAIAVMRSLRAIADLRLWRRLTRGRPLAVREVGSGPVIVRGRVKLTGEPLDVPGADDKCVAYEISEPLRLRSTRRSAAFVLEDESGSIAVRPSEMRVGAPVHRVLTVDSIGMKTLPGLARPLRLLRDGEEVLVVGVAQREADVAGEAGSYRDAPTRLVLRGDAAVRDVGSLLRYALPTLTITVIVTAVALSGVGVGAWIFLFGMR